MLFLRAWRKEKVRSTRHREHASRRPLVEVLEDRTLPSAYTFTKLTDAVTDPFASFYDSPAINNNGDVAFAALTKPFVVNGDKEGVYVAKGGSFTTIAQQNPNVFDNVGGFGGGQQSLSITDSGAVAFVATAASLGGSQGIYTSDGTAPPTLLVGFGGSPSINDSGAVAFLAGTSTPDGPETEIYRDNNSVVSDLTPWPGAFQPIPSLGTPFGFNNSGQVAFFAVYPNYGGSRVDTVGADFLYVTDGSTQTTISSSTSQFTLAVPTSEDFRPTINDSGTVAFIGNTSSGEGVYTGSGGPLTTIASAPSEAFYHPTINNNGDVAYETNAFPQKSIFLYNGSTHSTDLLLQGGDLLDGLTFEDAPFGIALNDSGQIAFVAQLLNPVTGATSYELFRADPVPPTLSIGDATVTEGNSGTTNASFTVTLSAASTQTVTVNYTTADGTATTADNDYAAASGTLTFAPGQTSKTITVAVNGDNTFEPDETFAVSLSSPTNATIAAGTGTGTILNDDPQPSLLSGFVYLDGNNNGAKDPLEVGIPGATVTLTGTDDLGAVGPIAMTTAADGSYSFPNLRPGTYTLAETQPAGYQDGADAVGTVNGVANGVLGNDLLSSIVLTGGSTGANYDFGELAATSVHKGQAAGAGFWRNSNGQALIDSFGLTTQGQSLADWLAGSFPNLFGNLAGKSNADVAAYYQFLFSNAKLFNQAAGGGNSGMKLEAHVLGTALSVFASTESLGGTTAAAYGFEVTEAGLGAAGYNLAAFGGAFGLPNNTPVTVLQLLQITDSLSVRKTISGSDSTQYGVVYGGDPAQAKLWRPTVNAVFDDIDSLGGI